MKSPIVGIMGPGAGATSADLKHAEELGAGIAENGWVLLTGGQRAGVMDAASRACAQAGGTVVGILPQEDADAASEGVGIAIVTGMGSARNNINVLSSNVVIICGMGAGTASEAALALKAGKPVVLLGAGEAAETFFNTLAADAVHVADSPDDAVKTVARLLSG